MGAVKKTAGEIFNESSAQNESETELGKMMSLSGMRSRVVYEDILPGVDIEYILSFGNVKENILVKERSESYE